jgi:hypothetical protein
LIRHIHGIDHAYHLNSLCVALGCGQARNEKGSSDFVQSVRW